MTHPRILVAIKGMDPEHWVSGLKAKLPQAEIRTWRPDDHQPADYVLYWKEDIAALAPRNGVKLLFNLGAGVDALVQALHNHKQLLIHQVPVIRLEDAGMASQMVQYALYCTLRSQRRFYEYENLAQAGKWLQLEAHDPKKFVVAVLGAGKLGLPVANAIKELGFPVRLYSRSPKNIPGIQTYAGEKQFTSLLEGARMLINLLPSTAATIGILNRHTFERMARPGYLVNLARGAHVVEHDLIAALNQGHIARAYLDVFNEEPLPANHPFWSQAGIEITPHVSARTRIDESVAQVAAKIAKHQHGQTLEAVDLVRGY